MSLNASEYDDLTVIKGIGPARQQWLREALHVQTFQDLAELSPDDIEARLKVEGRIAARSEIEAWIAQAQKRTPTVSSALAQPESPIEIVIPHKAAGLASKAGDWKPFAQFGVEFQERISPDANPPGKEYQTAVRHIETGLNVTWPGLESQRLCAWMLEQIGEKVMQEPSPRLAVAPPPVLKVPLKIALTQVRAFQPPDAQTPTAIGRAAQPMQGVIKSVEPLALEVAFELAEPVASDIAARIPYRAQFHVRHLVTGTSTRLGETETGALTAGQTTYTARLPATSLQTGLYRLQVLVSIESRPPTLGYFEIPLLQVV